MRKTHTPLWHHLVVAHARVLGDWVHHHTMRHHAWTHRPRVRRHIGAHGIGRGHLVWHAMGKWLGAHSVHPHRAEGRHGARRVGCHHSRMTWVMVHTHTGHAVVHRWQVWRSSRRRVIIRASHGFDCIMVEGCRTGHGELGHAGHHDGKRILG